MSNSPEKNKFSGIRKFDRYLLNVENAVAGVFYSAMIIIVFAGVIMRYLIKTPNLYGEELSRYLMVSCVYIGIAAGCRQKVHLNVELFVNLFPKTIKKIIHLIVRAINVFMYGFLAYQGYLMVLQMQSFGQTSPALRLPLWVMYVIIMAGFVLSTITEIIMYINDFFFGGNLLEEKEEVKES